MHFYLLFILLLQKFFVFCNVVNVIEFKYDFLIKSWVIKIYILIDI